jgi:class 3 adenylate cyclase
MTNTRPANGIVKQFIKIAALCCMPGVLFSQENQLVDSMTRLLKVVSQDTHRVNLFNEIAWELRTSNRLLSIAYLDSALVLARRLKFSKGEGNALNYRGVVEDIHGNNDAAISFFEQALRVRELLGDKHGVANLYNNIGNVRENQGDYYAALKNYQQSLRIREEQRDTMRMARIYYNLAILYENMGSYPEALDYILQHLLAAERTGEEERVANAWNILGNINTEIDRFEEALEAYQKSLAMHRKLGNDWETASVLNNIANLKDAMAEYQMNKDILADSVLLLFKDALATLDEALVLREKLEDVSGQGEIFNNRGYILKNLGSYYQDKGDTGKASKTWKEAEDYLFRSLDIWQKEGNKDGIMKTYNGIADVRRRQKRFREALDYTKRYYALAKELEDQKYQQNGLKDLARVYFALGEYKTAYEYREAYDELRYTRFNENRIKEEERKYAFYGDQKKQYEIMQQKQVLLLRDAQLKNAANVRNSLIGGAVLLLLLALVLFNRNKIIRQAKQRSEDLLLNILPAETAEELKKFGKARARKYDEVTVLFTDFQSFTKIAEETSAEDLVAELDECFQAFDEITARYGIEKIKTIGDAYLCASGLPTPSSTHAEDMVQAALDMQKFMTQFRIKQRTTKKPEFYCRIGIHSGQVVAGVVGKKKFAYDIWGDTVNLAARMEQSGEVGKVNISKNTYDLVRHKFQCVHRGKVNAKNKGALDMYFVEETS